MNAIPLHPDRRPRADHTMIGLTDSLCPECMEVVPAKIIVRGRRVYLRKRCPTHGHRDDFVCSDVGWWDRPEGHTPSVMPRQRSTATSRGCPYDCGLCPDHEQHTCIGLVELTDSCNLTCPMCFASSQPGQQHHSLEAVLASLDRLVAVEGRAEVCQLSGGEPTLHPDFRRIVDEALARPIDYLMVNTNGIRLARDPDLVDFLAERRERVEIYLQFDGSGGEYVQRLRAAELAEVKQRALDNLQAAALHVTLVATLVSPLPEGFYRDLIDTALARPNVTGLSLQPATYSGRHLSPEDLEHRITFPDCIEGLAAASRGMLAAEDFSPLPCAHPNCHQILLAARESDRLVPLTRYAAAIDNLDLLAGGISFTREKSRQLIEIFLSRAAPCGSDCGCGPSTPPLVSLGSRPTAASASSSSSSTPQGDAIDPLLQRFFGKVLQGTAGASDLLRITITSFLDAYNFDTRQLMKCCTHHVLPSGHVIPFCAYNTLYRPGHLPLPPLATEATETTEAIVASPPPGASAMPRESAS